VSLDMVDSDGSILRPATALAGPFVPSKRAPTRRGPPIASLMDEAKPSAVLDEGSSFTLSATAYPDNFRCLGKTLPLWICWSCTTQLAVQQVPL